MPLQPGRIVKCLPDVLAAKSTGLRLYGKDASVSILKHDVDVAPPIVTEQIVLDLPALVGERFERVDDPLFRESPVESVVRGVGNPLQFEEEEEREPAKRERPDLAAKVARPSLMGGYEEEDADDAEDDGDDRRSNRIELRAPEGERARRRSGIDKLEPVCSPCHRGGQNDRADDVALAQEEESGQRESHGSDCKLPHFRPHSGYIGICQHALSVRLGVGFTETMRRSSAGRQHETA